MGQRWGQGDEVIWSSPRAAAGGTRRRAGRAAARDSWGEGGLGHAWRWRSGAFQARVPAERPGRPGHGLRACCPCAQRHALGLVHAWVRGGGARSGRAACSAAGAARSIRGFARGSNASLRSLPRPPARVCVPRMPRVPAGWSCPCSGTAPAQRRWRSRAWRGAASRRSRVRGGRAGDGEPAPAQGICTYSRDGSNAMA